MRYQLRHLTDEIPRLEKRLEDLRLDIVARHDTSGDKFVIHLDGQDIRDRGIAGELLLRRAEKMRGANGQREIGLFAGFKLLVADNYLRGPELVFKGTSVHTLGLANTALGMIRSLEYSVQNLDEVAAALTENIKSTQKRITGLREQTEQPFEYAEKLAGLVQRQQEITDALDLAKNQAPNQLESKSGEAEVEVQSESQTEATTHRNGQTHQHARGVRVSV
jgi:hypothetical protein